MISISSNVLPYSSVSPSKKIVFLYLYHYVLVFGCLYFQGYSPVMMGSSRAENQEAHRSPARSSPCHNITTERHTSQNDEEERRISFPVPGASDCLHSSEDCVQFQIKKDGDTKRWSQSQGYFSTLPLDTETSDSCSVYTSEKLNFL